MGSDPPMYAAPLKPFESEIFLDVSRKYFKINLKMQVLEIIEINFDLQFCRAKICFFVIQSFDLMDISHLITGLEVYNFMKTIEV